MVLLPDALDESSICDCDIECVCIFECECIECECEDCAEELMCWKGCCLFDTETNSWEQ